jgi:hypothetical protein
MVDRLQYHGLLDFTTKDVFNSMLSRPMLIENKQVANEWGCGILEDSYGLEYTFAGGSETRSPKATKFNDTVQSGDDVVTNEYIHPSVWHRMEKEKGMKGGWFGGRDGYNPKALEGWTRDDKVKPAVWRKGNLTLEEYMIPEVGKGATGFGSVEKLLMPKSIQKVFVAAEQ